MAAKKATSSAKRTPAKSAAAKNANKTTTKVTTVKAVETKPKAKPAAQAPVTPSAPTQSNRGAAFVGRFNRSPLLPAAIAEFVGTFILATVVVTQQNQPIALLFGLIGIVLIIGGISGAHVNPAITVGAWVSGRIKAARAVSFIVAQILGAMLALVILNAFVAQADTPAAADGAAALGQAAQTPELFKAAPIPAGKEMTVLFAEIIGTFILGFAYASALKLGRDKVSAALSVGSGIFLSLVIAGTLATYVAGSAILNPAASIALQALDFSSIWPFTIYIVASIIGGVLGFGFYRLVSVGDTDETMA